MDSLYQMISEHFAGVFTFGLGRYLIAAGLLSLILWLAKNWSDNRRIQNRRAGVRDYRREISSSLRTVFIFGLTSLTTVVMIKFGWVSKLDGPINGWLFGVQFVAIIVAHDAYFYWMHRGLHLKKMFKFSHLHHHQSRTPTPWAAYSFSPFEAVTEAAFVPIYLLFLSVIGAPIYGLVIALFLVHMIVRNVMGHAGVELFPAGWTRGPFRWMTTTTHHDLHHSHGNSNFGLYFTWWDRWMGTEHPEYLAKFDLAVGNRDAKILGGEKAAVLSADRAG
ncbi:sterol desaturase family protein [Parasphingorhabdus sp.]|uniref:sterol desaturase family protein n=1 Tax=Parasphingorhabdus sp. TaxID=2709688 RepID=UPI003D2A09EE